MQQARIGRLASIGLGLSFGIAACGSTETDTSATGGAAGTLDPGTTQDVGSASASEAPAASATTAAADPNVGPLDTAVVTIGDERYEFSDVQCSIFAPQYIQAGNFGGDPEVSIVLPPEGWESEGDMYSPPSVRVQVGDEVTGQRWVAGDDGSVAMTPIPDGASAIQTYVVPEGRPVTATGSAMFIDLVAHNNGAAAPSVAGTFEVSCP